MDEQNLLDLKYINTDVYDIKKDSNKYLREQAEFRQFMDKKNLNIGNINFTTSAQKLNNVVETSENLVDMVDTTNNYIESGNYVNNSLNTQDYLRMNSTQFNTLNNPGDNSLSLQLQQQQAGPKDRFVQERKRWINIDSRDRDLTLYPDQNNYRVSLDKEIYTNIISVKLQSAEFINTQQLIRSTPVSQRNNIIQWNVLGDEISGGELAVYTATITPGNYNETTLAAEIESSMNAVFRVGSNG